MNQPTFVDAQEMHRLHPLTFEAPLQDDLDKLKAGEFVKVCCANTERFWCIIQTIEGNEITATVDNNLFHSAEHGIHFGDTVKFEKRHIYQTIAKH